MSHRPIHPSLMSLAEIDAAWFVEGEPPLPECAYDPELHTGPRSTIETTADRQARESVAREVCAACPARSFCDLYATKVRPAYGIWAGRTPAEVAERAAELVEFVELSGLEVA